MLNPARIQSHVAPKVAHLINQKFMVRHISTASFFKHKEVLTPYLPHAKMQGAVDCSFVSNSFLLADKPELKKEPWWHRILYGDNGSSHRSTRADAIPSVDSVVDLWKETGQVKLHALNITIKKDASLNGLGTRFSPDSFHCINIIKIFDINGTLAALSYDPEANCGISDIERIDTTQPDCDELAGLSLDKVLEIQTQCAMFRVDSLKELIHSADFQTHQDSGMYVATPKENGK